MRCPWPAPPDREALGALSVHEVVRDHPEALATLRGLGVEPSKVGDLSLEAAAGTAGVRDVDAALAWRRRLASSDEA